MRSAGAVAKPMCPARASDVVADRINKRNGTKDDDLLCRQDGAEGAGLGEEPRHARPVTTMKLAEESEASPSVRLVTKSNVLRYSICNQ